MKGTTVVRSWRILVVSSLVALMAGAPAQVIAADPTTVMAASTPAAALEAASAFRRSFGLPFDSRTVTATEGNPALDRSFGAALVEWELADVTRQVEAADAIVPVLEEAASDPDYFGSYLDERTTHLTIVTSGNVGRLASSLRSKPPVGVSISFESTPVSLTAINLLRDQIVIEAQGLDRLGVHVVRVGANARSGRLEVGTDSPLPHANDVLSERYGAEIDVVDAKPYDLLACTVNDCGTVGGVGAIGTEPGTGAQPKCTTAFLVEEISDPTDGPFMGTAGHCIQAAGGTAMLGLLPWKNYNAQTITWGKNIGMSVPSFGAGNPDAGYFRLGTIPFARNKYLVSAVESPIVGRRTNASQTLGTTICRNGWGSWYSGAPTWACGKVTRTDFSWSTGEGTFVSHAWEIDLRSYKGDSGAGMIWTGAQAARYAAGFLSGGKISGAPYYTVYTTQETAQSSLGIRACITTAC